MNKLSSFASKIERSPTTTSNELFDILKNFKKSNFIMTAVRYN